MPFARRWRKPCLSAHSSRTTAVVRRPTASVCVCVPVQVVQCFQHAAARAALAWLSDSAVLPRQHRLNRSADIRHVLRRGRRFAISAAVISVNVRADDAPSRLAVITPKVVGNSVVRHRVARVIRHSFQAFLAQHPSNLDVVVRAQAGAHSLSLSECTDLLERAAMKASV